MRLSALEDIVGALTTTNTKFIVVGGVAVVAHGYLRYTGDIDLVIGLDSDNIHHALNVLRSLGYKPSIPITEEQFADASQREEWIQQKGMKVLNFVSDFYQHSPVDIFVYEPFPFEEELQQAMMVDLSAGIRIPFVSLRTLIRMKQEAGRQIDLDDISHLLEIQRSRDESR
ncbi:MAG: nucleotidyl transferase AbiEii/AbiGii toxin family protein [Ignavibacteria bacterium]|nr:nucleotidyl transferase AbiEii/AbiGii toxin family protein [Ignavibacteria bacterium]